MPNSAQRRFARPMLVILIASLWASAAAAAPELTFVVDVGVNSVTERGLYRFEESGNVVPVKVPAPRWVRSAMRLGSGKILATSDAGLFEWENDRFQTIAPPPGTPPPKLIVATSDGNALIAVSSVASGWSSKSANLPLVNKVSLPDLQWSPLQNGGMDDVEAMTLCRESGELFAIRLRDGLGAGGVKALPKFNDQGTQVGALQLDRAIATEGAYTAYSMRFTPLSFVQLNCVGKFLY